MNKCIVEKCNSTNCIPFPSVIEGRLKWISSLKLNGQLTENSIVCLEHFRNFNLNDRFAKGLCFTESIKCLFYYWCNSVDDVLNELNKETIPYSSSTVVQENVLQTGMFKCVLS